jgi:DNA-binding NarL/FixJ family response regulator
VHQPPDVTIVRVSHRQYQVLQQLAYDGPDDETIARRLGISVDTVRTHLKAAYRKIGTNRRTAVALMVDRGELILKPGGQGSKEQYPAAA